MCVGLRRGLVRRCWFGIGIGIRISVYFHYNFGINCCIMVGVAIGSVDAKRSIMTIIKIRSRKTIVAFQTVRHDNGMAVLDHGQLRFADFGTR